MYLCNKRIRLALSANTVFIPSGAKLSNCLTVGGRTMSHLLLIAAVNKLYINAPRESLVSARRRGPPLVLSIKTRTKRNFPVVSGVGWLSGACPVPGCKQGTL